MSLELKPNKNDSRNHDVYSGPRFVGTIMYQNTEWYFQPNRDCGCVWSTKSLFELTEILLKMNQK